MVLTNLVCTLFVSFYLTKLSRTTITIRSRADWVFVTFRVVMMEVFSKPAAIIIIINKHHHQHKDGISLGYQIIPTIFYQINKDLAVTVSSFWINITLLCKQFAHYNLFLLFILTCWRVLFQD